MMIINLLSQEKQQEIRKRFFLDLITIVLVTLLLLSIFVSISLLTTKILLQNQFNDVIAQATLVTNSFAHVNQEIRETNDRIAVLDKLLLEHASWSKILKQFTLALPKDVNLKSLLLDRTENIVTIQGFANTRDSLLIFIDNLKSTGLFARVDSPISNIFVRNNVVFEIRAEFLPSVLLQ